MTLSIPIRFQRSFLWILTLGFLGHCTSWEYPQPYPFISTGKITNVTVEGVELIGYVESLGTEAVSRYGFVWGTTTQPTVSSYVLSATTPFAKGSYRLTLTGGTWKGVQYYVRSFVQTDSHVVYGNEEVFVSEGAPTPIIESFTPDKGFDQTEITIKGKNFGSYSLTTSVILSRPQSFPPPKSPLFCQVISVTSTELKVITPNSSLIGDFTITVVTGGRSATSSTNFSILGPRIRSLSTMDGRVGDMITLGGEYFDQASSLQLYFGDPTAGSNYGIVKVLSANQLVAWVPNITPSGVMLHLVSTVGKQNKEFVYPDGFYILNSWLKTSNSTPLASYQGYATAAANNLIYVIGGRTLYEYNTSSNVWTKKADFPGDYRFFGEAFTYGGKVFYGFGEGYYEPYNGSNGQYYSDLWQYDPVSNNWTLYASSPLSPRSRMLSFVIGDKAYLGFGTGQNVTMLDFWVLDLPTGQWSAQSTPFSSYGSQATSFTTNGKGYVIGLTSTSWEFDPSTSAWTPKAKYPDTIDGEPATSRNNHGLVVSSAINTPTTRVYEYEPDTDSWIKRQSVTGTTPPIQFAHYFNGKLYYASGTMWELSFD